MHKINIVPKTKLAGAAQPTDENLWKNEDANEIKRVVNENIEAIDEIVSHPTTGQPGPQGDQGPKGDVGPTGPQGDRGPQGDQGPKGITTRGPKGPTGDAGPAGDQGPKGDKGPKGSAGQAGQAIKGPQGPAGDQGPVGAMGDQGPTGEQGPPGDDVTSNQGPRGPKGPDGDRGPQGAQGPRGPKGPEGDVGPRGPNGLKGPTGDAGPKGPKGITGFTGPQGERGIVGLAGNPGDQGEPGVYRLPNIRKVSPGVIQLETATGWSQNIRITPTIGNISAIMSLATSEKGSTIWNNRLKQTQDNGGSNYGSRVYTRRVVGKIKIDRSVRIRSVIVTGDFDRVAGHPDTFQGEEVLVGRLIEEGSHIANGHQLNTAATDFDFRKSDARYLTITVPTYQTSTGKKPHWPKTITVQIRFEALDGEIVREQTVSWFEETITMEHGYHAPAFYDISQDITPTGLFLDESDRYANNGILTHNSLVNDVADFVPSYNIQTNGQPLISQGSKVVVCKPNQMRDANVQPNITLVAGESYKVYFNPEIPTARGETVPVILNGIFNMPWTCEEKELKATRKFLGRYELQNFNFPGGVPFGPARPGSLPGGSGGHHGLPGSIGNFDDDRMPR